MRARLTERQNQVYEYVRAHIRHHGKPPTLQEIGRALAIRSSNGVHKLVTALDAKGYLRRTPFESRGLSVVATDDPLAPEAEVPYLPLVTRASSHDPEHIRPRFGRALLVDPQLLGAAAADRCLVAPAGDDGMTGDGLRMGDLLVVEEVDRREVQNGELVAVLLDDRLVARRLDTAPNGRLHLSPSDRNYAEEEFDAGDPACHVVGRVRAVLRKVG